MPEIIHTTGITGFLGKTILPYLLKNFNAVINHGRQDGNKPLTLFTMTEQIIHETKVEKNDVKKYESNLLLHMATNYNPFPKNSFEEKAVIEANISFPKKIATWLLFDADWIHTKQSIQFQHMLRSVVSVGRVKWIPDSKSVGKDNCCWYYFDDRPSHKREHVKFKSGDIHFYGRREN